MKWYGRSGQSWTFGPPLLGRQGGVLGRPPLAPRLDAADEVGRGPGRAASPTPAWWIVTSFGTCRWSSAIGFGFDPHCSRATVGGFGTAGRVAESAADAGVGDHDVDKNGKDASKNANPAVRRVVRQGRGMVAS
jgi:hypothetical protein